MKAGWKLAKLGDLLAPTDRAQTVQPTKEYRLLGVRLEGRGPFIRETVTGAQTSAAKLFEVKSGDFIYSRLFACRGAFGVIGDAMNGCFVSSEFPVYQPMADRVDVQFLRYWFTLPSVIARVDEDCTGSTPLTRNRFKENFFLSLEIPLPPLAEQRRIVARIEALAGEIEEAIRLRNEAVVAASALFGAEARKRLANSFPTKRMDGLCSLITDGTHQTPRYVEGGGHTFLSAQNVKPFRFMPEVHRKVSSEDYEACMRRVAPKRGDVLMTRVGAGIGEAAVMNQELDFAFYVSLALVRPDPDVILPEFLVHWLNSPDGRACSRRETLGKGHSQGNLNLKLLRGFNVPLPPLPEQRRIVAELDALQAEVDALKRLQSETAAELDALLPAILDRAFKGELD